VRGRRGNSSWRVSIERSVAVGGAQVEDQITEIAVDGELRLERPAEKKRSLSLTDRALPQDASKEAGIWNLTAFRRMTGIYSRLPDKLVLM